MTPQQASARVQTAALDEAERRVEQRFQPHEVPDIVGVRPHIGEQAAS